MLRRSAGLLIAATLCTAGAQESPAFDPSTLKGPQRGTPNEVLVLGTVHLSQVPDSLQPAHLRGLHERLLAWSPRVIAIEALSGPQCHFLRQFPGRYGDTVRDYCWDPAPARAATGLDVPGATAEIERLLAAWPKEPTPAQRRRLAALFLAGGERISALVQWLHLSAAERKPGDGLDGALAAMLDKLRTQRREDTWIAAPLAAALGLERVHAMDDHTADAPYSDRQAAGAAIMKAWDNPANARRKRMSEEQDALLGSADGVLSLYRAINEPALARLIYDSDFGAALNEGSPQQFGRSYVNYWETRNLRMAANIREAAGARPGGRTLVIVGASHKWYLEAYLNQMHDVRVMSTDPLLGSTR